MSCTDIDHIIRAIDWSVTNDVRIINLSIENRDVDYLGNYHVLDMVVDEAVDRGANVITIAGNLGEYDSNINNVTLGTSHNNTVTSLGTNYNGITVGNMDDSNSIDIEDFSIRSTSGRGPVDDGRLKPDVVAPGTLIVSPTGATFEEYREINGTSFAAPHVSGTVALLLEAYPGLDPLEVKGVIIAGATWKGDTTYSATQYDAGVNVDIPNAWGFGLLDAAKSKEFLDDGNKIILDTMELETFKYYSLSVTEGVPVKIFLVWNIHLLGTVLNPIDGPIYDLDFTVRDSNGHVEASSNSNIQTTEFVMFTPTETADDWEIIVSARDKITKTQKFVLASTNSINPLQVVNCHPTPDTAYDWYVLRDCELASDSVINDANVIVDNGSRLTIPANIKLDIDFTTNHLLIKDGSSVLIKHGGTIT